MSDEAQNAKASNRSTRMHNPFGLNTKGTDARKEQLLREINNERALQLCRPKVKAFADCAKANNLFVVVACRKQNKAMNDCLRQYTNDEAFEQWKKDTGRE